jgi:CIC family chloride channel protein
MFRTSFFRNILHPRFERIDQAKPVYMLSFTVGLLSAFAAVILKNAINYTHQILAGGMTNESGSYLYLAYPLFGMLLVLLFVRYLVKDNISHGISRVLIKDIHDLSRIAGSVY